jgi:hypothetical protein
MGHATATPLHLEGWREGGHSHYEMDAARVAPAQWHRHYHHCNNEVINNKDLTVNGTH